MQLSSEETLKRMRGHFSSSSVCWNEICIYGLITISLYPLSAQRLLYFNLQPQEKNSCALGGENQQRSVNNNRSFCLEKHSQARQGTFNIQAACYRNMLNAKANTGNSVFSSHLASMWSNRCCQRSLTSFSLSLISVSFVLLLAVMSCSPSCFRWVLFSLKRLISSIQSW